VCWEFPGSVFCFDPEDDDGGQGGAGGACKEPPGICSVSPLSPGHSQVDLRYLLGAALIGVALSRRRRKRGQVGS
jgi:MYXO-CTERM domain-containing protein